MGNFFQRLMMTRQQRLEHDAKLIAERIMQEAKDNRSFKPYVL